MAAPESMFEPVNQAASKPKPPRQMDFNEQSRAVVASDGDGNGGVIWYFGGGIWHEIREVGLHQLGDLGLDDAPEGISIWEGNFATVQCGNPLDGYDYETETRGAFRAPTDDEWKAIRAGESPWKALEESDA